MMYYIRKEKTILSEMAVCCCDSKGPSDKIPLFLSSEFQSIPVLHAEDDSENRAHFWHAWLWTLKRCWIISAMRPSESVASARVLVSMKLRCSSVRTERRPGRRGLVSPRLMAEIVFELMPSLSAISRWGLPASSHRMHIMKRRFIHDNLPNVVY